ncbi:fibrobacter succinogenes major paralogous domain-containing protein [Chryseobacterium chendengshani]|uniref:FISUMP domain-containing protein n=1 Tax=unclassified Chryseobacterium TaxID=2593645 RepID=UPI001C6415F0|nr:MULTISPECIES: FISUMP domain-containing protein [unclassified Chryseobacterium]MBW7675850.1 fibrobacter succinogenes major paralogous domain-containing protein [Chryseobacterium sp. LJ756]MBW8524771.1 fibrobacter succinogenes major paralogous domain-containing protein [Chryseobacterium sp. LJ668]QYK15208.1 fibrobacter succinogenes major paralogous domain-containing protein [Chryseobacterium sp. LJ668]
MNKYILTLFLLSSTMVFSQVTIGKSLATSAPATLSVSIEFGDAAGGQKGIVLPWATTEAAISGTTPAPITGTLFFDSTAKKVKLGSSTIQNATAINQYLDLSAGAAIPAVGVGVADANAEVSTSKTVVSADLTTAQTNTTNGILVLADTNKAMVLPRVNSYADIVNPSPGMMVYVTGTSPNQLAVFNGSEWSFWSGGIPVVTSPTTGRIWMDRNLGAAQVATSSTNAAAYGDLYQWGRLTDGHQIRTSTTTATTSTTDVPGNANFITSATDWRTASNNNLWQGISGINNPCPVGFRIPTITEFTAETAITNAATAFTSPLKLTVGGSRTGSTGALANVGTTGSYYTSTISGTQSSVYTIAAASVATTIVQRATGASVRCIKN